MGRFPTYFPTGSQYGGVVKKREEPTIHLLPSIQEVLGVREGDKAVLGLASNEQLYNSETKSGRTF
jgi:hypothetical protein